jgi:hypothetical protein
MTAVRLGLLDGSEAAVIDLTQVRTG